MTANAPTTRPQRPVPPFGSRVRAGDVEGMWGDGAGSTIYAGSLKQDDGLLVWIPRGMEQHLVLVEPERPAWTEQPGACGADGHGNLWQRRPGAFDEWLQPGDDTIYGWSEVPALRELVVREEQEADEVMRAATDPGCKYCDFTECKTLGDFELVCCDDCTHRMATDPGTAQEAAERLRAYLANGVPLYPTDLRDLLAEHAALSAKVEAVQALCDKADSTYGFRDDPMLSTNDVRTALGSS